MEAAAPRTDSKQPGRWKDQQQPRLPRLFPRAAVAGSRPPPLLPTMGGTVLQLAQRPELLLLLVPQALDRLAAAGASEHQSPSSQGCPRTRGPQPSRGWTLLCQVLGAAALLLPRPCGSPAEASSLGARSALAGPLQRSHWQLHPEPGAPAAMVVLGPQAQPWAPAPVHPGQRQHEASAPL